MSDLTEALRSRVEQAASARQRLHARGAGSYGLSPGEDASILELGGHRGVVSFEPSEMVLTVRAGTPIVEVEALLAGEGQRLGVECPLRSESATIGGAIAMGLSGSARPFNGALRDFVLGVRMINGDAEVLRFGGQVMKNVAGYDVSRMLVGSQGEMGVLLDVSLRVLPLPEEELCLAFEFPALDAAVQFSNGLLAGAEPLSGASFHEGVLHLRFSGRAASLERLRRELGGETDPDGWWSSLRRWDMPWGPPGFRSYRSRASLQPRLEGSWLADWNGGLVWSDQPDEGAQASVELATGRAPGASRTELQQGLCEAFDPLGLFGRGGSG